MTSPSCIPIEILTQELGDALRGHPQIVGTLLCGSVRLGISDALSDLDVWVVMNDSSRISRRVVLSEVLPRQFAQEELDEGRSDQDLEYLVLNVVYKSRIVNLKFLHYSSIAAIGCEQPTLDQDYLDNLENYVGASIISDTENRLEECLDALRALVRTEICSHLAKRAYVRYSSYYWRSAYQGIFRDESAAWMLLAINLVDTLVKLSYLITGALPPPQKWIASPQITSRHPTAQAIAKILELRSSTLAAIASESKGDRLEFYARLHSLESVVFEDSVIEEGFWWRGVFTERPRNTALDPSLLRDIDDFVTKFHLS